MKKVWIVKIPNGEYLENQPKGGTNVWAYSSKAKTTTDITLKKREKSMRAVCTKDESHDKFITTAHVTQSWVVDDGGEFLEELSTDDTTHGPNPQNIWVCAECGEEAKVS